MNENILSCVLDTKRRTDACGDINIVIQKEVICKTDILRSMHKLNASREQESES